MAGRNFRDQLLGELLRGCNLGIWGNLEVLNYPGFEINYHPSENPPKGRHHFNNFYAVAPFNPPSFFDTLNEEVMAPLRSKLDATSVKSFQKAMRVEGTAKNEEPYLLLGQIDIVEVVGYGGGIRLLDQRLSGKIQPTPGERPLAAPLKRLLRVVVYPSATLYRKFAEGVTHYFALPESSEPKIPMEPVEREWKSLNNDALCPD